MVKGIELKAPEWMRQVGDYLKQNENSSWEWFSSVEAQSDYADTLRMELLKSTYRLSEEEHLELYGVGREVLEKLELVIPLTFYQSQSPGSPSAAIYYLPGEAHIVFFGNLLEILNLPEQKSIIAHELAHYKLWQEGTGKYLIADRFLEAMANHSQAENSHIETARRYRLYTEIYADRGSLYVMEDLDVTISALVKVHTGMKQVSASSYLDQANEIFSKEKVKTEGLSHPEGFIRARALQIYKDSPEMLEKELDKMILGQLDIDELDLLQQANMSYLTIDFIKEILTPTWLKTKEPFANRLTLYKGSELSLSSPVNLDQFFKEHSCENLHEYFSYLLLDFVALDREILPALALHCSDISHKYSFQETYEAKLYKELKVKKSEWKEWLKNKAKIMAEVAGRGDA
jgi:hypothetical protein